MLVSEDECCGLQQGQQEGSLTLDEAVGKMACVEAPGKRKVERG